MSNDTIIYKYFNWETTKGFLAKLFSYKSTKVFLTLLTLFSFLYAIDRETFLQNDNNFFLPFISFLNPSDIPYYIDEQIDLNKTANNYIFILDRSFSINNSKNTIRKAPIWYINTIAEFERITGDGSVIFPEVDLSEFDIIKMKLIQFIIHLKLQNKDKINIAIWTVDDNSKRIYPPPYTEQIFGSNLTEALLTLYSATIENEGYKNTNFLELFRLVSDSYKTKNLYKDYEKPEYVFVFLSDMIHDVEEQLGSKYPDKDEEIYKVNVFKEQIRELCQLVGNLSIQNLVTNVIILENFYSTETNKYRFNILPVLDSCFVEYQLSHFDINSSFAINFNIFLDELKFYYENPYEKITGTKKIFGIGKKGSIKIGLIPLYSNDTKISIDFKILELNNGVVDSTKKGRLILGNDYQQIKNMSSNEILLFEFSERELPDFNNIKSAIHIRFLESGFCNFIIPIKFVRILSRKVAIILALLEITILITLLIISNNTLRNLPQGEYNIDATTYVLQTKPLLVLKIIYSTTIFIILIFIFLNGILTLL